jgi:cell division protein FtsW
MTANAGAGPATDLRAKSGTGRAVVGRTVTGEAVTDRARTGRAVTDRAATGRAATVTPLWSKIGNPPLLWRPLASYYLLLASTALLVGFGLVMVWSSSYVASNHVSFAVLQKQVLWVGIGLPVMFAASRLPVTVFRMLAYPAMVGAGALLVAVTIPGLGVTVNGATRWVDLGGPFTIQPSEFAKLGLVLWGADLLARKHKLRTLDTYRRMLIPLVPVTVAVLYLIKREHDLGTMLVVVTIVLSLLWVIGAPMRLFGLTVSAVVAGITYLAISEPYRLQRLANFGHPFKDFQHSGWQGGQGIYALGAGGWWGVGLGGSRQKWGYLPEAHTDFIFAIIGEELGLVGTLAVLALFAVLAYSGIRVAQRSRDTFSKLAASAIVAWVLVQAIVNIGAVIGLLPITGIPLPLISAGGSALLPTMFALGMLMSLARREPSAVMALAARGPNLFRRSLSKTASVLHLSRGNSRGGR